MLKRVTVAGAVALVMSVVIGWSAALAADSVTVKVDQQSAKDGGAAGFNESGTATLTAMGDKTQVVLSLTGAPAGTPQPAHIHVGTCPGVGAVKFPLSPVVDGKSTTVVDAKLADITTGAFGINVHKSAAEAGVYVSCGTIQAVAGATTAATTAAPAKTVPTGAPATGGGYAATHNQAPVVPAGAAVIVLVAGAAALRRKLA